MAGTPPEESPNHPGHPLSLVMWAYADPRDVVDAHIRVRGARLFALGFACLLRLLALLVCFAPKTFRLFVFGHASLSS